VLQACTGPSAEIALERVAKYLCGTLGGTYLLGRNYGAVCLQPWSRVAAVAIRSQLRRVRDRYEIVKNHTERRQVICTQVHWHC
jgi:hypothetical protein